MITLRFGELKVKLILKKARKKKIKAVKTQGNTLSTCIFNVASFHLLLLLHTIVHSEVFLMRIAYLTRL